MFKKKPYTKHLNAGLRDIVEEEIKKYEKGTKFHIAKSGILVAKKKGKHDFLLVTPHNGSYVPEDIVSLFEKAPDERRIEEDIATSDLYMPLFNEFGGVFFNVLFSRYFVNVNDKQDSACFKYDTKREHNILLKYSLLRDYLAYAENIHDAFYELFTKAAQSTKFLFIGHSMCDRDDRPDFAILYKTNEDDLGLADALRNEDYSVKINDPFAYSGANLCIVADKILPNGARNIAFETNKKLYMYKNVEIIPEKLLDTKEIILNIMKKII